MPGDFRPSSNRLSGSILAATLVFLVGGLGVAFIVAAGGGDPLMALVFLGGSEVLLFLLAWLLQRVVRISPQEYYGWMFSKVDRADTVYSPRRKAVRPVSFGTNRPPSVEEVRDLKESPRTWVPAKTRNCDKRPE